jgi:hypothetical protein
MSVTLKCSKCGKSLEPAALPKDREAGRLWCPLCADLKDVSGVNIEQPTVEVKPDPSTGLMENHNRFQTQAFDLSDKSKVFHVQVGDVTAIFHGRVDLTIGQTKVTIT